MTTPEIIKAMRDELATAKVAHNIDFRSVHVAVWASGEVSISVHAFDFCEVNGDTISECASLLAARVAITGKERARELREKARELLSQASSLEAGS